MTLKKAIKLYMQISGHKGIFNYLNKCQCDLTNLMHCDGPKPECEFIERGEK